MPGVIACQLIGGFGVERRRGAVCPPAFGPPEDISGQKKPGSFSIWRSCVIQPGTMRCSAAIEAMSPGAKAALRAVLVDHGALYRVKRRVREVVAERGDRRRRRAWLM